MHCEVVLLSRMCTACCGLRVPSTECGYMSISWVCALKPSSLFYTVSEVPSLYWHSSGCASIVHRVHYKQLEWILLSYFLSYVFWLLAIPFASENATETDTLWWHSQGWSILLVQEKSPAYICVCVCVCQCWSLVILVAGFVARSSTAPLPILSKNRHGSMATRVRALWEQLCVNCVNLVYWDADHRFGANWIVCASVICCHLICEELETYRQ